MTSYRYVAVQDDDDPFELDRNQNITKRTEVLDFSQTRHSDDDDRVETRSTVIRVRSQSLKHLNERAETGSISRSKSLRDVDASGEFASVKARVSYVDSWNPVNPVGRGRIAERVKSWENTLDEEEAGSWKERKTFSSDNGMDRRKVSYNGTRARGYDNYYGSGEPDWRDERYESYQYNRDSAEKLYGSPDELDTKMPDTDPTSADAEWKKIQQNTFTRWCNEHLKCVNKYIYNLETDLNDGLKLIALLQVLSHKKITRYNKKPSFRPQKMENISIALKFIESENIRLVNIDASDIFKGNIKLILGLIWTLILKYQISMPYLDEEEEQGGQKMTPKQALLAWCKSKMPESIPMDNFNKDWNDGRAVACLVDAVAPGLFPECEDLDPKDKLENARQAMQAAEDWLGVPQVITPEEITNPNVDELSVMTYVSYFPEAKLKPGAPLRQRTHPSTKCSAKGPGVEPKGLVVKKPANFTVFTQGAGAGKLSVLVWGPGKVEEEVIVQDNGDHTYSCQYFPPKQGKYDVHVKWNGRHIPKSPFRVEVGQDLDASQAYASGPGLQPEGIQAGKYTDFTVYTKGAGEGQVSVKVIDPRGGEDVDIIIEPQEDAQYFVEYQPVNAGKHTIKVMFGGQPISKSPFHVMVSPPRVEPIPSKVRVFGTGVEPTGLKAGQRAPFTVDAKAAGDGELDVFVEGPQGEEKVDIRNNGDGTYSCMYYPNKFGKYIVNVSWSSVQVPNSPFNVKVAPAVDASRIKAYGPGLEKGTAGRPCEFTVETKGAGIDSLGFAIEGPSQAEIHCQERSPGICDVRYYPTVPGKYAIHVTCGDEDIPKSPFMVPISPAGDPSKVYAKGPGLEPEGVVAGVPAEFTVFTREAGDGDVDVRVIDNDGKQVPVDVKDNKDGTYTVIYYPTTVGAYTVNITFNTESIPKSPFKVNVCQTNSSACRAYGPGLEKGFVNQNNEFKIETKGAGEGGLGLTIEGPSEAQIECKDNGDGSCDVKYLPPDPGDYMINILFADEHIPGSPFKARISYPFDVSKVNVEGPGIEPGIRAGEPADIDIDTRMAGDAELKVEVVDELNSPVQCDVEEEEYGIYAVTYYPKEKGGHKVNVKYGGKHAPGSPFKVPISPKSDASKVKVTGPGVEKTGVQPGKPTWFIINATEAGKGDVHVKIEPRGRGRPVDVKVTEEGKDTFRCEYVAPEEGEYRVDVKFDGSPVPGSPFPVEVAKPGDAGKCKAQGDGLETAIIDQLVEFDVDCKSAGEGQLMAAVDNPSGAHTDTLVTDNDDGTYSVSYTPFEEGIHTLSVKFGGDHIPGSPFKVDVLPPTDPSKCKAYGPGLEKALVDRPAEFTVETKGAGAGGLSLAIEGPSEAKLTCKDHGDGTCSVKYTPVEPGDYEIHIKFADEHIPGSPFNAKVTRPIDVSKVKCYGPGVDRVNPLFSKAPQEFTVDTSEAGDADLEVTVETPDRKVLEPEPVCEKGDGVYTVAYTPEEEGRYAVNVKYNDKHVPNSPFRVRAGPPFDASKVKVSGVDESPVTDEPAQVLCDCTEAGTAPLTATVSPPSGPDIPVEIKENGEGCYIVEYTPERAGRHSIDVKYGNKRVPRSPFRVQVKPSGDASKVEVDGLGPKDKFFVDKENDFTIDTSKAGKGVPKCTIKGPNRKEVPCEVLDNGDGTYDCVFTPEEVGRHNIDVLFGGEPVPGSPFNIKAEKPVKPVAVDKIKCEPKVDKEPLVDEELVYAVDARPAESAPGEIPEGLLNGSLLTPSGDKEPVRIKDNEDGTYDVACVPKEPGPHELSLDYDGVPLPGSPYKFDAVEGGADKVKAYGKGLERGLAGEPAEFTIVTKDAGPGGLALAVHGPSKAEIKCQDNGDGTCSVQYIPEEPGDYNISCKFADKDIPGSPFTAHIYSNYDDLDAVSPRPTVGKPCDVELNIPESFRPEDVTNGILAAELERPDGRKEPLEPLRVNPDGTLAVTFIPYEPGEHLIHVYKHGQEVQNSPFSVMVQAQRVGDIYPVGHTCELDFKIPEDVDVLDLVGTLKRPSGKVDESLTLKPGPKPGTISVSFVPREVGEHFLSVKKRKDGSPIPGSPFSILVESEEPTEGVGCPIDYCFSLDDVVLPDDILKERVKGTLKRPSSDKEEPIDLKLNSDNTLSCSFVPRETGLHYIYIRKYGRQVDGSPFVIKVTAPEGLSKVGKPYGMGLESSDVNLPEDYPRLSATLKRPSSPKEEELKLVLNGDNTLGVAFTPREEGEHLIHLRKDNKEVEGSPFSVMVGAKEEKVEEVHPMGRTCDVNLDIQGVTLPDDLDKDLLRGFLKRPNSEKEEPLVLEITRDNSLGVSFVPEEPGEHQISVRKKSPDRKWRDVPGSPFSIMVEAAEAVNAVGTPCDCLLDIPNLRLPEDLNRLTAKLKRPSSRQEEDLKLRVTSDNKPFVSFVPREPGEHLISIKKNRDHVKGSPFSVMVVAPETGNAIGRPCGVGLEIPGLKLPDDYNNGLLTANLQRPSGKPEEPLPLALNSDNTLSVSFTPQETGEHFVTVKKSGNHVNGSPFSVMVSGPGPADPSKVVCTGPGLHDGVAGKPSTFTINTRDAGYGGLGLSIEGPSKAQITCTDNEDGTCTVEYLPVEPGKYTINVKFADEDVPGSPFTSNVRPSGDTIQPIEEDLVASSAPDQFSEPTQRVSQVFEDLVTFGSTPAQPHDFVFDLKGYNMDDLETMVISPDGTELESDIIESGPKTYTIRFVPKESGEHTIYVRFKSGRKKDIPGSPFKVFVEAPVWGGAAKCLAAGPGLERGVVNQTGEFTVWTRDAGPGGLAIAIEGPAKSEIKCTDNGDGSCNISYLPTTNGEYTVHIRFADEDIPGSPFKVNVSPEVEDRFRDLNVSDLAESGLKVNQPASFSVQTNASVGDVTASVISPSGEEKEAQVSKLGGGNFAIRFTPREFGDHLVNVRFDGSHIPGSPFKIRVGGAEGHPEKVKAYGSGLSSGRVGEPAEFTVNALEAGSGALALSVDGPAKVKMNCSENADGTYQVTYNPVVAGEYTIRIKFAGQDIPGSPYNVTIHPSDGKYRSDGDASKCTSRGTGLHSAVLGQPNSFTVNASNAGRGSLMVGVEGPAIPAKEINVKHTGSNVYAVNYALEEPGVYILKVLWADKHIPGSPFHVTV